MYYLVDKKNKIIFGWSPKCGCSFVKNLFYFLTNNVKANEKIHGPHSKQLLPKNHNEYKIIIIVRNPYERIVSGFLEKYKKTGKFYPNWPSTMPLTFHQFVTVLHNRGTGKIIDNFHFSPQLRDNWDASMKIHRVYDIKAIDYPYLEKLYKKKIPEEVLNFKHGHENITIDPVDFPVYKLNMDKYEGKRPTLSQFYDKQTAERVFSFYKKDFFFLKLYKIPYDIPLCEIIE